MSAQDVPSFIDSATVGNQTSGTLTITKNFSATGTNRYLLYIFQGEDGHSVSSVTWNGQPMTPLNTPTAYYGMKIYAYGLADPDVGASYAGVVTMSDGYVYDGSLLLYAGVSSTQVDSIGSSGSGSGTSAIGQVSTVAENALPIFVLRNGNDEAPTPGGDAILRSSEHGVVSGAFAVFDRGPFETPGTYSVSSTFSVAGYAYATFSLKPARQYHAPVYIDSAAVGNQTSGTLTITKNFSATGTSRYLLYFFQAEDGHSVSSVTWNNQVMTPLNTPVARYGTKIYAYGLADPDVGASHAGVVTMSDGNVYDGSLLLYANASAEQFDAVGTDGFGSGESATGQVTTISRKSLPIFVLRNGNDEAPTPGGDAILRSSEHGVVSGAFAVFDRGPFEAPGMYSVSSTFSVAGYSFATFSLAASY